MQYIAHLLLFGLGFVILPFGTSWHETPKVVLMLGTIILLSTGFFWEEKNWKRLSMPLTAKILLAGIFTLSLVSLLTQSTASTFFGNAFRLQGVLLLWALILWSVIGPILIPFRKNTHFIGILLITLLVSAILGRTDPSGRAVGTVGEANALGAFSLFLLPLSGSLLALFPTLGIIFLSGSRSALTGLLIQGILLGTARKFSLKIASIIATFLLVTSLLLPFIDQQQNYESRKDIWRLAVVAGWSKPILGWGIGNGEVGLKAQAQHSASMLRYQYIDSSHNVFLDWWVQGGVVGVGLFSATVIFTVRQLILQEEKHLLASFFGILTVMLFNPVSVAILLPFWWIVGVGLRKSGK